MNSVDRLYRIALICGLAPLAVGCGIFGLWCAVGWDWLMFAGLATMWAGIASVFAGGICLGLFAVKSAAMQPRPHIGPRIAIGLICLLVNLPAAFLIIVTAGYLFFSVHVTVTNQGLDLERLVVAGGCAEADFGPIPAGATRIERIVIKCDGSLDFQAWRGDQELSGTLVGYRVTHGEHLDVRLVFAPDGTWSTSASGQ